MFLIIDDDVNFLRSLRDHLNRIPDSYVDIASKIEDAESCLSNNNYKVVICDINLGDVQADGYSLYKKFRTIKYKFHNYEIPTQWIFISGDDSKAQEFVGLNNSRFILKKSGSYEIMNAINAITTEQNNYLSLLDSFDSKINIDDIMILIEKTLYNGLSQTGLSFDDLKSNIEDLHSHVVDKLNALDDIKATLDKLQIVLDNLQKDNLEDSKDYRGWILLGKFHEFMLNNKLYGLLSFVIIAVIIGFIFLKKLPLF